ncbi:MAG: hypothetical protein EPN93_17165 [Spirochaetes bacterium]|nr:MAG: hypothetical protein EPN93_17165 [Spirochaetota bacterium]
MNDYAHAIAKLIERFLTRRFIAGEDVMRFAESALGMEPAAAFADMLEGRTEPDPALESLLYAPPDYLKEEIEPCVHYPGLSKDTIASIIASLSMRVRRVEVTLPGSPVISAEFGPIKITEFACRLRLDRRVLHMPEESLLGPLARERYIRVRVLIRHSPYILDAAGERFLAKVMRSTRITEDAGDGDFAACIALALRVLGDAGNGGDLLAGISRIREAALAELEGERRFDEALAGNTMEFLMANRVSAPVADPDRAGADIRAADLLCSAVFGRVP